MHSELPAERWVMDRERCRSGRSGRTRNAVYGQLYRGFESLSLRKRPEGRVGCKHSFATFFIFGAGRIYPERSENESWAYGAQAKIRSSQGRLRSDGGKDGRHAVTRSRARSAEEWKRGEMLYGNTAFLSLQRGKVVRMGCRDRMADTFFVSGHLYPPAGSGRGVFCEADPQSLIFQTIKFEKPQTLLAAFQLPG